MCHLHSKQNFRHCTTFPTSRGLNGEQKTRHRERPLIAVNVKLSGGGGGGISFWRRIMGDVSFCFRSEHVEAYITRKTPLQLTF